MKHRALILQAVIFAAVCYCLLLTFVWGIHFPIFRLFVSIVVALLFLAAEAYAGYVITRQLWHWSGAGARRFLKKAPEPAAVAVLTEERK